MVVKAGDAQAKALGNAIHGGLIDTDLQNRVRDRVGVNPRRPPAPRPDGRR